jgi:hypothetical protein
VITYGRYVNTSVFSSLKNRSAVGYLDRSVINSQFHW